MIRIGENFNKAPCFHPLNHSPGVSKMVRVAARDHCGGVTEMIPRPYR
jgi:hypothetical protein